MLHQRLTGGLCDGWMVAADHFEDIRQAWMVEAPNAVEKFELLVLGRVAEHVHHRPRPAGVERHSEHVDEPGDEPGRIDR